MSLALGVTPLEFYWFSLSSGVRQGSVLSPALFTVFVNVFIVCITSADLGCYINRTVVSCVLHADDIILLSASVNVLQRMLNIVIQTAEALLLQFNVKKSTCIALGPKIPTKLPQLMLGNAVVEWSSSIDYLGGIYHLCLVSTLRQTCHWCCKT